jgi:hypothetical protein
MYMYKIIFITFLLTLLCVSLAYSDTAQWLDLSVCEEINNNLAYCMGTVDYALSSEFERKIDAIKQQKELKILKFEEIEAEEGYSLLVRDRVPIGEGRYCYDIKKGKLICQDRL